MAMEVIKPPSQPASQGAGGSYGNGSVSTQIGTALFTSENCNPNMEKEVVVTPGKSKCAGKKTPVKSKTVAALGESELGKSPVRRRLDCDENGAPGKSPAKGAVLKETLGVSPHKHFCRSPRCAVNNPDYAVPAPRQYLKSKRHLLAGWQPPVNSKLKTPVRGENTDHGCNTNALDQGLEGEHVTEERNGGEILSTKPADVEDVVDGKDGDHIPEPAVEDVVGVEDGDHIPAGAVEDVVSGKDGDQTSNDAPHLVDGKCSGTEEVSHVDALDHQVDVHHVESHGEELAVTADGKDGNELDLPLEPVIPSVCDSKGFDASMRGMSASTSSVGDISLESSTENAEVVLSASSINIVSEELPSLRVMSRDVSVLRGDLLRASKTTDSDFSMHSIGEEGSDSRRLTCGSSRPPRRRYVKRGGRRLSSGAVSTQSFKLHKQDGLKRKQAEEWMWDTAVKEAVQRLAPQVPGSVNVLVKAFESVKLTEEEIQRAKYKNTAVEQLVLKDSSPLQVGCGPAVKVDVSQMETIASIHKVQAWDESMASADLVEEVNADKLSQGDEDMASTPKHAQSRIPLFSSKSEPPKLQSSRWATASDESMTAKDDTFSDKGASSTSGKSRITEWTCDRKSQAGRPHKQKLKRCTSLHPFRLRTEERGAMKDYVFSKRLHQLWKEEERLRIPLAQGLPWTTEEPAFPPKPPVKEQTKPERFKLITDVRAVERAEFDEHIAERQKQEELQRVEEERQRQIAEEEEVRRLRREMVPRAQLMPYFDRPFMPRRSSKKLTVPREPKFHLKQRKRPRCMASCNSSAA